MSINEKDGPLKGLLVIDFTCVVSGPFCTQLLSDNGARVIKIERPGTGDIIRHCGVLIDDALSKDFAILNGGKESFVADLKSPEDRGILEQIIAKADVLVENFRPGVMDRAGLGYQQVKQINSAIIYASISGFGQSGPIHAAPAYDEIVQANSGLMSVTGFPDGRSTRAGFSLGDVNAGIHCYASIMTALFNRSRTGEGCRIDTAMLDCMISMLAEPIGEYAVTGEVPRKQGNDNPSITPFSTYATKDREIALCVASPKLWGLLLGVIGKSDWLDRPEFAFPEGAQRNKDQLRIELEAILKTEAADYWLDKMHAAGVPCANVNTIQDMAEMEQVKHRRMLINSGGYRFPGNPIRLDAYPVIEERPMAPSLAEHTNQIKKEFSATREETR